MANALVLVALCLNEPKSAGTTRWYSAGTTELVSGVWCVTEFTSALSIKQHTRQVTKAQAQAAWQQFERLFANDLQLAPIEPGTVHHAALLTLDATTGLRASGAPRRYACSQGPWQHWITCWRRMPTG